MNIAKNVTELVGKTPLVWLDRLAKGLPGKVAGKRQAWCNCTTRALFGYNPRSLPESQVGKGVTRRERRGFDTSRRRGELFESTRPAGR